MIGLSPAQKELVARNVAVHHSVAFGADATDNQDPLDVLEAQTQHKLKSLKHLSLSQQRRIFIGIER